MKYSLVEIQNKNPEINVLKVLDHQNIRPIVNGFYIWERNLFTVSYIWKTKPIFPALFLKEIGKIQARSYYGYPGLFKPSIAEVIQSIPDNMINDVHSFKISGEVLIKDPCHEFEVTLYRKKKFSLRSLVSKFSLKGIA